MKVTSSTDFIKCDFGELNPGDCFCVGEILASTAHICLSEVPESIYNAAHLLGGAQISFDYTQPVILLKNAEILLFGRKQGDKNVSQV